MPVVWVRTISMTPFFQGVGHLGVARTLVFSGGGGGGQSVRSAANLVWQDQEDQRRAQYPTWDEDLAPSTMKKVER